MHTRDNDPSQTEPTAPAARLTTQPSPTRRSFLKAAWVMPAIVAFGPIAPLGASQSPGRPRYPNPESKPKPEPESKPKPEPRPKPKPPVERDRIRTSTS